MLKNAFNVAKGVVAKVAFVASAALPVAGVMVSPAHATIDVTAVTTGITDAQTAITTIITNLLALSTALFGLALVYRYVKRRAGA